MSARTLCRWLVVLTAPALGAGLCAPTPFGPPDQPGDCEDGASAIAVEAGTGYDAFVAITPDQATETVFGAQGGSHVWLALRATGFGAAPVDVELEATDAYAGLPVGRGAVYETRLNQVSGAAPGTCDFYGIPLFLSARPVGGSSGLARVTLRMATRDGRAGAAEARVWVGEPRPECVPAEGVAPALVPRHDPAFESGRTPHAILDGETLEARSPSASQPAELLVGAQLSGFAASATRLRASLLDPLTPAAAPLALAEAAATADDAPYRLLPEVGPGCAPTQQARLVVPPALDGREVLLELAADDGLGHAASISRRVKLRRVPLAEP
jgi:hypothetical protein